MTPARMTREQLVTAVERLPGASPPPGFVVDSEDIDTPDEVFCREHAEIVARGDAIITGCEMFVSAVHLGIADGTAFCAFHGCAEELDAGGLTDYGVDSALALTETDPFKCRITPHELKRSAWAMADDDPRWATWERQARRVLTARHRSSTRRRAA